MRCEDWQDRMAAGEDVRIHVLTCAECRAFTDAMAEIDAEFAAAYSAVGLPAKIRESVLRGAMVAPRRPSFVPEVLDFVGWAAVVGFGVLLARQVVVW